MDTVMNPAYLLRSYAWGLLKANMPSVWSEELYGEKIPIVPLAEEPDLDAYDGPHIVYGWAMDSSATLYPRKSGSLTFAVYDQNFRRLTQTMNILQAAFEQFDESARKINLWTSKDGPTGPFIGMNFAYTNIAFVEGGTPEEQEGGRQSALINIRFEYHVEYNIKEYNGTTWA